MRQVKKVWTLTYTTGAGRRVWLDDSVTDLLEHVRLMGITTFHLSCSCRRREVVH